jgi:hypothetical protein
MFTIIGTSFLLILIAQQPLRVLQKPGRGLAKRKPRYSFDTFLPDYADQWGLCVGETCEESCIKALRYAARNGRELTKVWFHHVLDLVEFDANLGQLATFRTVQIASVVIRNTCTFAIQKFSDYFGFNRKSKCHLISDNHR